MKKLSFIFCCLIGTHFIYSQQRKSISGYIIIDAQVHLPRENIQVKNINSAQSAYSNAQGQFSIFAREGDLLEFLGKDLQERRFLLNKEFLQGKALNIHLNLKNSNSDRIDTVTVYAYRISGQLKKDVEHALSRARSNAKESGIKKSNVAGPSQIGVGIVDLLNLMNGKKERNDRLERYTREQNLVEQIKEFYGEDFFIKKLKIAHENIEDFIKFTADRLPLAQLHENKKFFELQELLKEQNKSYKKTNKAIIKE